jgi:hypothetical protein
LTGPAPRYAAASGAEPPQRAAASYGGPYDTTYDNAYDSAYDDLYGGDPHGELRDEDAESDDGTDPYGDPYGEQADIDGSGPDGSGPDGSGPDGSGGRRSVAAVASSVADQGVAAFTNIIVLVVAARLSTAAGFAVFSMVYMVFTVLLGVNVSYVGQALVLERGSRRVRAASRSAVVFTAVASAVLGWGMAGALLLLPGTTARGLAVLGLVLPVVLTQDGMRYCFSALRLPHLALAADVVRLLVAVPALAVQPQGAGAVRLVAVWGLSGVPALLVGAALLRPASRGRPSTCARTCGAATSGSGSWSSSASATPPASSPWWASGCSRRRSRWGRCAARRPCSGR